MATNQSTTRVGVTALGTATAAAVLGPEGMHAIITGIEHLTGNAPALDELKNVYSDIINSEYRTGSFAENMFERGALGFGLGTIIGGVAGSVVEVTRYATQQANKGYTMLTNR